MIRYFIFDYANSRMCTTGSLITPAVCISVLSLGFEKNLLAFSILEASNKICTSLGSSAEQNSFAGVIPDFSCSEISLLKNDFHELKSLTLWLTYMYDMTLILVY